MIDTGLLDLINSGDAWVFIGSGVSVDSGLPSWANLASLTLQRLPPHGQQAITHDARFQNAWKGRDFPKCFQRMQDIVGLEAVGDTVMQIILEKTDAPGDLARLLADWPAAGYLTTNYDALIESALQDSAAPGWIPVGNQPSEIRKVSGDVRDIVWHIHGSVNLSKAQSTLVIGSSDYDDQYLRNSDLKQQLSSFLTQRRLVFVGFGLRDPEIMRLLRLAGQFTIPERPIYAFLGSRDFQQDEDEFQELRLRYNIEIQKYRLVDDTHRDLRDLLTVYSSMIVRRSTNFGQPRRAAPSYDPDATGLLIYNTLVLQAQNGLQDETLRPLLSARILSAMSRHESVTLDHLRKDVGRITGAISGEVKSFEEIDSVVAELKSRKLIVVDGENRDAHMRLTTKGHSFVAERAGIADRIREQFRASLVSRANDHLATNPGAVQEVALAGAAFFEECIEKRSLGVAMALHATDAHAQEFQVVALLQALPSFFDSLSDPDSARALVKLVQGVLSAPTEAEAKHCGLLLQARLGVHLLGVDRNTLKARIQALRGMAFVLDSTSLIPLLAVSGRGHKAAVELMTRIARVGAQAFTTPNLLEEVREHAAYATRLVQDEGGALGSTVLNNLMGKEGQTPNVFLHGFAEECAAGSLPGNGFALYMHQRCGFGTNPPTIDDCHGVIAKYSVIETYLPNIHGFVQRDYAEIEELRTQIEERRRQSHNYRHERQVQAEAEVVVLVQKLRDKQYTVHGKSFDNVFFVSNSRFIDRLNSVGLPVTMRQNVLLQWLGTVAPFEESELPVLIDGLLWELSERGFEFIDRRNLRAAFGSTISAAREDYPRIVDQHKILIANEWGIDPTDAFQEPFDDLEFSSLLPRHAQQTIDRQQRELDRVKASMGKAQASQELSQSERVQLERLRSEKAMRVKRNRRKARSEAKTAKKKTSRRKKKQ